MSASKRQFMDLGGPEGVHEDERIRIIGNKAMLGNKVAVLVEDCEEDPGKPQRYIDKVTSRFPGIECASNEVYMQTEAGTVMLLSFRKKPS